MCSPSTVLVPDDTGHCICPPGTHANVQGTVACHSLGASGLGGGCGRRAVGARVGGPPAAVHPPPPPPSTRPPALPSICNASLRAAQSHHSFPLTGGAIFFRILHSAGASTSLNIDPFYVNCHYNDHLDIAGLKFQFVYFTGNLFFNGLVEYRIVSQKNQPNG